jgi:hypothetical protein
MKSQIFIGIFLVFIIKCASDADNDRKTKVAACLNLLKSAIHHDNDYFSTVSNTIDANDRNDLQQKFLSKTILNCYSTVSLLKSAELLSKKFENISPLTKENKEILNVSKYDEKYKNDQQKLSKDTERVDNALKELQDEHKQLEQMVQSALNEFAGVFEGKREQKRKQETDDRKEEENFGNYENGNLNLAFVKKMSNRTKYLIFFGLFAVMALFFLWGLKTIMKKPELNNKKKKKI